MIQSGPRTSRLVIVGEAPGATEAQSGVPFTGESGRLLNDWLQRARFNRDDAFVTNVCHIRPPQNDFDWFYTESGLPHLIAGIKQLKADLTAIRPNVILGLGAVPLEVLTGQRSIAKYRGSILPCSLVPGLKVVCTYHPSFTLRTYEARFLGIKDTQRAVLESSTPDINYPTRTFYTPSGTITREGTGWKLDPGPWALDPIATRMLTAPSLAIDIETRPAGDEGTWDIICVGFSDHPSRALVLRWADPEHRAWITRLCESPVPKVFQNGMFDTTVLRRAGVNVGPFSYDTMFGHHTLLAECSTGEDEMSNIAGKKRTAVFAKGLGFQTSFYTREPYYKDDGKTWRDSGDISTFWRYNALDAAVTLEIATVQRKEIDAWGVQHTLRREVRLAEPLMAATNRGLLIDPAERQRLDTLAAEEESAAQQRLNTLAGEEVNVKSPPQIIHLLYDRLKLPRRTQDNRLRTDKDVIIELATECHVPGILDILNVREQRDLRERYINAKTDADGAMRCSFDVTGTLTGRLSSRKGLNGSGTNLQTIPAELRSMFVARPGHVLVYADYSQAEARVVAYLARCQPLIDLFNDPTRDVHRENAARMFSRQLHEVTDAERGEAKRTVHGGNYGISPYQYAITTNQSYRSTGVWLTVDRATFLLGAYHSIYPEIRQNFWGMVESALRTDRVLDTFWGRKRAFYVRPGDDMLKKGYAQIPQSTIGDLTNEALISMHDANIPILLTVHDSIIAEVPVQRAHETAEQVRRHMAIPLTINGHTFTIPTDVKIGYNWGDRSQTNPRGLTKANAFTG